MNPNLPKLRMQAANLVIKKGLSTREVARHTGFDHSTIVRWVAKAKRQNNHYAISTLSSRPRSHPHRLSSEIVQSILDRRKAHHRCAEVIHHELTRDGIIVSLSSVKRTLKRHNLTYPSKWKKWHCYPPRPLPERPGILVEIDSMYDGLSLDDLKVYALIDVCSRWAQAKVVKRVNSWQSARFLTESRQSALFQFKTIQTDHGSEFAKWFSKRIVSEGLEHRHTRVRKPTDNSHVERFIGTLQRECLSRVPKSFKSWQREIPEFIHYYNTTRPHMGLNMKTPLEVVQSY
jgi:transposase InsO family protein